MNVSLNIQQQQGAVSTTYSDVVVLGAGPYGLSTAAHLLAHGLKVAIFGKRLHLWREHMPQGMLLRSYWWATNLSDPKKQYGFEQYFRLHDVPHDLVTPDPTSRETFIDYALWFQQQAVPNVDETFVTSIERKEKRFEISLVDGRVIYSPVVVMAPGLAYYVYRPAEYDHLSAELVSHPADHCAFDRFVGKRVIVIGGGQSALETAALLHENGTDVQIVSRSPIVWLKGDSLQSRSLLQRVRHPIAGISPGWFNWGLENLPYAFQQLPRSVKDRLLRGRARYGPAGAHWLKNRLVDKIRIHEMQRVQEVKEVDDGIALMLSNNELLRADHIILGTGYRVDIKKLPMLHASLISEIATHQDAPILNNQFESSVPGLYFVGFSSVSSCGPLFRFVVGTDAAARRVAGVVARQLAGTQKQRV